MVNTHYITKDPKCLGSMLSNAYDLCFEVSALSRDRRSDLLFIAP